MKTKYIYTSLILLLLIFSGLFSIATAADAQDVHALIIILGNDKNIRDGVEKNEDLMMKMLKKLSDDCTVKLTVMKSKNGYKGEISRITYVNQKSSQRKTTQQDIIESRQVAEWLENLRPKPQDTVLIYYTGHGKIDDFDTHELIFDPGVKDDTPDRAKISQRLKEKQARLRMLITDTCSSPSQDLPESAFKRLADVRERKRQNYPSDLFLKHEGFLDITAASPGQFAIAHDKLGGHFTSALLSRGFTATADTNNDKFLEWQETFNKTKARTEELYDEATFDENIAEDLHENRQTTQEPYAHSLPKRIGRGGDSEPTQPNTSTAILNFTSVPPGAKVAIDGGSVGITPLKGYELEMDGQRVKNVEVTLKAAGYVDWVETLRVQRGKSVEWNFKLIKKDDSPMALIPAGELQGAGFVNAFHMDIYEVTNEQYKAFVDANSEWQKDNIPDAYHDGNYLKHWSGNDYPSDKAKHPVTYVSWYAAMAYAQWMGKRLPTEAEWEYAARGGLVGKTYPWGDSIDVSKANCFRNYIGDTTPVGEYPPNGYGLYDMCGNVAEWCLEPEDITKLENDSMGVFRRLRGGSWASGTQSADVLDSRKRLQDRTSETYGFRCVKSASP